MRFRCQAVRGVAILSLALGMLHYPSGVARAADGCLAACALIPASDRTARRNCETNCAIQQNIREAVDRINKHYLALNALRQVQCFHDTGDWQRCFGIYRLLPIPPPDPFDKKIVQSLSLADSKRLRANLEETAKMRYELERKFIDELFRR